MATALEQLRYIDEQLAAAALPPDQAELVRLHRLTGLQLRNQRLQGQFQHFQTATCLFGLACDRHCNADGVLA